MKKCERCGKEVPLILLSDNGQDICTSCRLLEELEELGKLDEDAAKRAYDEEHRYGGV